MVSISSQLRYFTIFHRQIILMIIFFQDGEDIKGQVNITLNKNKRIDHLGVRVELIGVIENLYDKN